MYELIIGLEVHAELLTASKMFCGCRVVDSVEAEPNTAVCPVCLGLPGMLPVVNRQAIDHALRVALALNGTIHPHNVFARKSYFYPDLPKGYQISQYELPLATGGWLAIEAEDGTSRRIGIRRVHMEEDTGKSTHVGDGRSLLDFNRSGVPLLEIVSEPDLRTPDEVYAYAVRLRQILRYLGVNSGDMEKGVLRVEPNISVRRQGELTFGTRTEIKNLNSFRALAAATAYEFERQVGLLEAGQPVRQETRGWDEGRRVTFTQRVKEEAEDYRYFPEPDLPALVIPEAWIARAQATLPALPAERLAHYTGPLGLGLPEARVLVDERAVADWFEAAVAAGGAPRQVANWMTNQLFSLLNERRLRIDQVPFPPRRLVALIALVDAGQISQNAGRDVLAEMFERDGEPAAIVARLGLDQISDRDALAPIVDRILAENPDQVAAYLAGKTGLRDWFVGQVMRATRGKANPAAVNELIDARLAFPGNG